MPDIAALFGPVEYGLAAGCGMIIGFVLALIGGGGSLLATPMLLYVVGVRDVHSAIGTAAFIVAGSAFLGLLQHHGGGQVSWKCGRMYAAPGVLAALAGSSFARLTDGQVLLGLYAGLLLAVAGFTALKLNAAGDEGAHCHRGNAPRVLGYATGTGLISGFFGIGGGFLIVPGLVHSIGLPIARAMATSLLVVAALGAATAVSYALTGQVLWGLGAVAIAGGMAGTLAGSRVNHRLKRRSAVLNLLLTLALVAVAITIIVKIN